MITQPPRTAAPEAVLAALDDLAAAEAKLTAARAKRQECEAGVREARVLDQQQLAAALAADQDHPGRPHRDEAERALTEATEIEAAWGTNIEAAQERLQRAVRAEAEAWAEAIAEKREKADGAFSRALAKLREAEAERAELLAAHTWLQALAEGRPLHPPRASDGRLDARHPHHADAKLPVSLALDLLAQYGQASGVEGERQAAELAAEREAEAEQRRERQRAARTGGLMAP